MKGHGQNPQRGEEKEKGEGHTGFSLWSINHELKRKGVTGTVHNKPQVRAQDRTRAALQGNSSSSLIKAINLLHSLPEESVDYSFPLAHPESNDDLS